MKEWGHFRVSHLSSLHCFDGAGWAIWIFSLLKRFTFGEPGQTWVNLKEESQ